MQPGSENRDQMTVAVVIRAFNEEAHIGRLLTGIRHQGVEPDELILVDSGSTDATVSIAEAFGCEVLPIAREEFSFGRALNRGIAAADADLVVMASAHVYPIFNDWLERLLDPFEHVEVGLSFGRQTVPVGGRFSERRLLAQWFPNRSRHDRIHPFCNNANAAIRRDLWCDQPYDEQLTGLEDLAWAKAIIARGYSVAYAADAPVVHVHEESFAQIVNRYRREAIAHREIYPGQSLSAGTAIRLGLTNIAKDLGAARRERQLKEHLIDIVAFRSAQFYGTVRGFSQSGPVTESLRRRFYYPPEADADVEHHPPRGDAIDYETASHR
jgi:rhamnosyltransferase